MAQAASSDPVRYASFVDNALARLRGENTQVMPPEEAGRQLLMLAEAADDGSNNLEAKTSSLLARMTARRILAASALALFYVSGDYGSLQSSQAHASAAAAIFESLYRLLPGDKPPASTARPDLPGTPAECLGILRRDLQRLSEDEAVLKRYGLFELGLDFGPADTTTGPSTQPRFRPLGPGGTYSQALGYGWLDPAGIVASPPPPGPGSLHSTGRRRDSGPLLRLLSGDWLRGDRRSRLRLNLPDGSYRVTSILENQPELAAGAFRIEPDGPSGAPVIPITYAAGEFGDKTMDLEVKGGILTLSFSPENGSNWLIAGLIIARRSPHLGYVPVRAAEAGSTMAIRPTLSSPEGPLVANLGLMVDGRHQIIPLMDEGLQHAAQVTWPQAGKKHQVEYFIEAQDAAGHSMRWPETGFVPVRITDPE